MKKMKYKWGFGLLLASLLLAGCGSDSGGSSTKSKLKDRDIILIAYNADEQLCKSARFQVLMEEAFPYASAMIFSVESNSVTCATYGRQVSSEGNCQTTNFDSYKDTSCVVGFNVPDKYKL